MNISPTLMLVLGLSAAFLFLTVFIISAVVTRRNRRIIRRHASRHPDRQSNHSPHSI